MLLIYNIGIVLLSFVTLPYLLLRGLGREKHRIGLRQRLGFYPKTIKDKISGKPIIWIQAVSVGEVLAIRPLIPEIRRKLPEHQLLISTTTLTGHHICLQKVASDEDIVIYFPLDYSWIIKKSLRTFRPVLVALVETEIWPNFICSADKMGVPVVLVNGRISDKSFRGYKRFKRLIKRTLSSFSWFGMQTENDAKRVKALGADPDIVHVMPSLKYEGAMELTEKEYDISAIRSELRLPEKIILITAGSTHDGEEVIMTEVFNQLRQEFPDIALLLAPRHPRRVPKIVSWLRENNISFNLRSDLVKNDASFTPVIILDTLGELMKYYTISTIVFVGKSLCGKGGQNPIEPAVLSKPVIFGPYMDNFREASELLLEGQAAIRINTKEELANSLRELLLDPGKARQMGKRGYSAVLRKKGAVERTVSFITEVLR